MSAKVKKSLMIISLPLMALVGCADTPESLNQFKNPTYAIDGMKHSASAMLIAKKTYDAVDMLINRSLVKIDPNKNILATSIVDVSDIESSSALGRLISEQISGRIAQQGYTVSEPKLRSDLSVNTQGEMMLSRSLADLRARYDAQAVITGTYAVGAEYIHINLKLIALDNGQILSSMDYILPASEWYQRDTRVLVSN